MLTGQADRSYRRLLARHGEIVDRFEDAWVAGTPLEIEELLASVDSVDRLPLLTELVHIDLERRITSGEAARAESYFSRFPEIAASERAAIEFIAAEFTLRRKSDDTVSPAEYGERFPQWREAVENALDRVAGRAVGNSLRGFSNAGEDSTLPVSDTRKPPAWGSMPSGPPRSFGDYELLDEIARGGMGVVYKARQAKLNRLVALKMIRSGELADEEQVQRFYAEAEAAAKLDHPGIVPVYEVGQANGQHFFSMALVVGRSLNDRVKTDGPLPPQEAARLLKTVVEAVEFAHGKGIIHRDIKPQNILLDEVSQPRLTDFGLAKQVKGQNELTATGQVMGTPSYMPPEQASGKLDEIGPASDVYSLGATLYFVLSGRPPFQTASTVETLEQVLHSEPVPLRRLNPAIPRDLETICLKCLEKDATRRYTAAQDLADELGRYLRGEPILARSTGPTERMVRWCRRNPVVAGLNAMIALLLVGVAVASTLVAIRMGSLAHRESEAKLEAQDSLRKESQAKLDAKAATIRETQAKQAAQQRGDELRMFLSKQYVDNGMRALDGWNYPLAMFWFVQALELDAGDPEREAAHRMRVANTFRQSPRLSGILFHDGPVASLEFSTDGRRLVTASYDHTARIWDAATGRPLGKPLAHDNYVYDACFSPDGNLVATASADRTVRIWDAVTCEPISEPLRHWSAVNDVDFSHDGTFLVTACGLRDQLSPPPGGIKLLGDPPSVPDPAPSGLVWQRSSGKIVLLQVPAQSHPMVVSVSPDDQFIATGSLSGEGLALWSPVTGELVRGPFPSPPKRTPQEVIFASSPVFSPDNKCLALTNYLGTTFVFDVEKKALAGPTLSGLNGELQFLDDPYLEAGATVWNYRRGVKMAGVASQFGSPPASYAKLFAVEEGTQVWDRLTSVRLSSVLPEVPSLAALSKHGQRIALMDQSHASAVFLWDRREEVSRFRPLRHGAGAAAATFVNGGTHLVTTDQEGEMRSWNLSERGALSRGWCHYEATGVDAVGDGPEVVSWGGDRSVRRWNVLDGSPLGAPLNHEQPITSVAFTDQGKSLLTSEGREMLAAKLRSWDLPMGRERWPEFSHGERVQSIVLSPNGKLFATGGGNLSLRVYDVATGQPVTPPLMHDYWCARPAFSPSGNALASPGGDRVVRVWEIPSGRPIAVLPHDSPVYSAAYASEGQRLISSTASALMFWETRDYSLASQIAIPRGDQTHVHVAENRSAVLAAGGILPARAYDLHDRQRLGPPFLHPVPQASAAQETRVSQNRAAFFSPDASLVVTLGRDRACRVWDFTPDERSIPQLKALAELQLARRLTPQGSLEMLTPEELKQRWLESAALDPGPSGGDNEQDRVWMEGEALRLHVAKRYEEELRLLDDIVMEWPDDVYLRELRGEVAHLLKKDEVAIEDLELVVAAGLAAPSNWRKLLKSFERAETLEEGIEAATQRLEADPGNGYLWHLRGVLRSRNRQRPEAADDLAKAVELGAGEEVHRDRAECLLLLGRWGEARASLARAVDFDRLSDLQRERQIYVSLKMNDLEGARREFAEAVAYLPESRSAIAMDRLAWMETLHLKGDLIRARNLAELAIRKEPKNASFVTTLATVEFRNKSLPAAKQRLDEAVVIQGGGTWREWLLLALVEHQLGQIENAHAWLAQAKASRESDESGDAQSGRPPSLTWREQFDYDTLVAMAELALRTTAAPTGPTEP